MRTRMLADDRNRESSEWLELRIVELSPGLVHLGTNLEEATAMQQAHLEVLTKLQSKQSPVEDLLNQADQLISTQRPRAEVYAAMAESLGLAWKELNQQLETRKTLLDLAVVFQTRARQYSSALDAAEKAYTDNLLPSEVESCRELISALHDHKRSVLEASMYTLQEGQVLLSKLRSLLHEGATMDSRPQHIRISIDFACSQVEHQLEALHDRRRFLDSLFTARRHHLDQCLALALLYQDLTEAVVSLKALRDEVSSHQGLGETQTQAEVLLHEHQARDARAKSLRDVCIRHVSTAEQMVTTGHYAGVEARARAYNVLEAATALHETCDTRGALLRQAVLFFKLAQTALTKLEQAEVQLAGGDTDPRRQRLSTVLGVVEEAVQPALHEGYAIIEVTGGRGQSHNAGVCAVVDELERRRKTFSTLCADATEQDVQRTHLLNQFLELHNTLESWLLRVGDGFMQGHQDPGGSLRLAQDFLHLHLQLISDTKAKNEDLDAIDRFLVEAKQDLPEDEHRSCAQKASKLRDHWQSLISTLEKRISLIEKYVQFLESAEKIQSDLEQLEKLLRGPAAENAGPLIEETWHTIRGMIADLNDMGAAFIKSAQKVEDPYLDSKRATLSVETILDVLNRKQLLVTELHSQYTETIRSTQQMITIWNTYKRNIDSLREEFEVMEQQFCPLLRGDVEDPDALAAGLDSRLQAYIAEVKDAQHKIQEMITKAELTGVPNVSSSGARDEVVTGLLQFFQLLQASSTNFQILASMLTQWCCNIAEIHRSCSKFEEQFRAVPSGGSPEAQLKEHHAARQAVHELLRFARSEADGIVAKIRQQCPTEPGREDISKMEELLQRRQQRFEESWTRHFKVLESSARRSQYDGDLQGIIGQLEELSSQLLRMQSRYGDSLPAALSTRDAFTHFRNTVTLLQERIETFLSNAQRAADGPEEVDRSKPCLSDLQNKWSTFHRQVGNTEKNIELSIEFFKHVNEAEDWFRGGSRLLVDVAGESSSVQTPDEAHKLRTRIESFLKEGEPEQQRRITTISALAADLYGPDRPAQVDALCQQNKYIIESLSVITKNLTSIETNLKMAENYRQKQEQDQQALAASLVQAQAEADAAKQAAVAADEARQLAEEVARKMAESPVPKKPIQVEIDIQTEAVPISSDEDLPPPPPVEDDHVSKKTKFIDDQPDHMPPVFITPLVGATVQEGVKFSFECRVMGYPVPEVEWFKDNLSITKNPDYKTTFENGVCCLTIEETFTEDSALFTCQAYNASGRTETSATLTVKETEPAEVLCPPAFTRRLPPSTLALEGAEHQLEATVTGHPLPVVSWLKNDSCVDESPDYVITYNNGECVLRFEEVFMEDAARYLCRATNELGQDETSTNMTVTAKSVSTLPVFVMPLNNLMARAGQKFKLECQVKGDPLPTVAWFHNGRPVKETPDCKLFFDADNGTATLLMSEAFPKNGGVYSAVAKNTAGEAQCTATVSVKGRIPTETSDSELPSDADVELVRPSVQLALRDTTMVEGGTARLDCVIVGQPEPEVIWYHDDKPVKESTDFKLLFHGDRCSLVITEAYPEDAGTYKVVARNSAGEASTACFLSVQPAPEPEPPVPQEPAVAPRFTSLLADSHVTEGGAVTLRTSVSGSPKPNIAWFRDGEPLMPDHGLLIQQDSAGNASVMIPKATFEHTGQYEVVASNCAGTAKCIAFLSIEQRLPTPPAREPDSPPVFTRLLNDVVLTSGESITFEVDVKGSPKPVVSCQPRTLLLSLDPKLSDDELDSFEENEKLLNSRVCDIARKTDLSISNINFEEGYESSDDMDASYAASIFDLDVSLSRDSACENSQRFKINFVDNSRYIERGDDKNFFPSVNNSGKYVREIPLDFKITRLQTTDLHRFKFEPAQAASEIVDSDVGDTSSIFLNYNVMPSDEYHRVYQYFNKYSETQNKFSSSMTYDAIHDFYDAIEAESSMLRHKSQFEEESGYMSGSPKDSHRQSSDTSSSRNSLEFPDEDPDSSYLLRLTEDTLNKLNSYKEGLLSVTKSAGFVPTIKDLESGSLSSSRSNSCSNGFSDSRSNSHNGIYINKSNHYNSLCNNYSSSCTFPSYVTGSFDVRERAVSVLSDISEESSAFYESDDYYNSQVGSHDDLTNNQGIPDDHYGLQNSIHDKDENHNKHHTHDEFEHLADAALIDQSGDSTDEHLMSVDLLRIRSPEKRKILRLMKLKYYTRVLLTKSPRALLNPQKNISYSDGTMIVEKTSKPFLVHKFRKASLLSFNSKLPPTVGQAEPAEIYSEIENVSQKSTISAGDTEMASTGATVSNGAFMFCLKTIHTMNITQFTKLIKEKLGKVLMVSEILMERLNVRFVHVDPVNEPTKHTGLVSSIAQLCTHTARHVVFEAMLPASGDASGGCASKSDGVSDSFLLQAGFFMVFILLHNWD
ncbi:Immunoglobulin I-set [Trinorchestia longiramus]|nr:Immunoglobulin I-set [Trinorchestia longiramus]